MRSIADDDASRARDAVDGLLTWAVVPERPAGRNLAGSFGFPGAGVLIPDLATPTLALMASVAASAVGGVRFVSAFDGGLAFGAAISGPATTVAVELADLGGGPLSLVLWSIVGAGFMRAEA